MKNLNFHNNFKLNGNSFSSVEEILLFSDNFSTSIHQFLKDWFSDDDTIIVQTSGSTGKPKLISIRKEFMVNSALSTGLFFNLSENTTALLCVSTNYIAGKMMLVRALVLGWKLDVVAPSLRPLRGIDKAYNFTAMVPLQLHHSIDHLANVDTLIVGGGVVSNQLIAKLQSIKTQIFATYGMTETVTHIAVKKLNHVPFRAETKKSSYYQLLPNIAISQDYRNCLVIDAPKVASATIVTNDVIHLVADNEFEWLGRFDNVINSGGIKLHPEQIEEKLSKIISQRFFVIGVSDAVLGKKLVLVVEFDCLKSIKVEKFKSKIQNNLKNLNTLLTYEIPKEIYFVEKFIETATGKIQRRKTLDLVVL